MSPNLPKISETAQFLITLLHNADELVTISNKRKEADDVIKAFKIYATSKAFPIPEDKVDNFSAILLDARPITLSYLLRSIANDVKTLDRKHLKALSTQEKKRQEKEKDKLDSSTESTESTKS